MTLKNILIYIIKILLNFNFNLFYIYMTNKDISYNLFFNESVFDKINSHIINIKNDIQEINLLLDNLDNLDNINNFNNNINLDIIKTDNNKLMIIDYNIKKIDN